MRLIATAAVVLGSLAFSVGGVAIVGRADSSSTAKPADAQCSAPVRRDVRIPAASLPASKGEVIVLNTRGYNYPLPGDLPTDPTIGRTQSEPGKPIPDSKR